jgi:GNAT superfamily N-acetyltransferase
VLRIESAADRPDALAELAQWHWDAWGSADPGGSAVEWAERLRSRTNRGRIPFTLLAFDADALVGGVSVVEHDMPGRPDLAELHPWISGTFVAPERRGQGVGTALLLAATAETMALGIERLYLYTESAAAFYHRLDWKDELLTEYEGNAVTVMSYP